MPKKLKLGLPKNVKKVLKKESKSIGNQLKKMALGVVQDQIANAGSMAKSGLAMGSGAYRPSRGARRSVAGVRPHIGSGAYRGMGAYRGSGSYNQLFPDDTADKPMKIASPNNETGIIRIEKREYLFDVFAPAVPASFTVNKFQVNPGLGALSPFLAQICGNYEKFRYRKLIFTYHPVVTDSSSTGQMGSLLLAFNSNPAASSFVTKQAMAEYDGSLSVRICDEGVLGAECEVSKGASSWLFVRPGSVPAGQDIKTYDFGSLQVATSGISAVSFPAGTQLGEMWVEYEVELAGPKLYDALGFSNLTDTFYGTTALAANLPLGSAPYRSGLNSLGGVLSKVTVGGGTTYTLPDNFQGWLMISLFMNTSAAVSTPALATTGNVTGLNCVLNSPVTNSNYSIASSSVQSSAVWYVNVAFASAAGGNTLIFSYTTVTAGTFSTLVVSQFNSLCGVMAGNTSNYVPI